MGCGLFKSLRWRNVDYSTEFPGFKLAFVEFKFGCGGGKCDI